MTTQDAPSPSSPPTYNPMAGLLDVAAAAKLLGVSENSVYRLMGDGKLARLRHGNRSWIEPAEIDDYFARQRAEGAKVREQRAKKARRTSQPRSIKRLAG